MKNSKALFQELVKRISITEDMDEIHSVVYRMMESVLSVSKTEILAGKDILVKDEHQNQLTEMVHRINTHEPIQYILEETDFYGRKFKVTDAVLIPRPETEELIDVVKQYASESKTPLRILDIGTGSGCISVTLALEILKAQVSGTDISELSLNVARENAEKHQVVVNFFKHDILKEHLSPEAFEIVVSNPPYIAESEKTDMDKNVLEYEPHAALFVPDTDPLLFYKALAQQARVSLTSGGLLAVEINERFGKEVAAVFADAGFTNVNIFKDLSGKERIVTAQKKKS